MKKLPNFSCALCLLGSLFTFPSCNNSDPDVYIPMPKLEDYFEADPWGAYQIEQYGEWHTVIQKEHPEAHVGEGYGGCIVAKQTVKIVKIKATCADDCADNVFDYATGDKLMPDTWTTTIYTENYTLTKGVVFCKTLTMTPESNPDLPEVLQAGDEIKFISGYLLNGRPLTFAISNLDIVIQNEDFPNGVYLQ